VPTFEEPKVGGKHVERTQEEIKGSRRVNIVSQMISEQVVNEAVCNGFKLSVMILRNISWVQIHKRI
jgi:hypothetical protein